jgi:hypothetical protein
MTISYLSEIYPDQATYNELNELLLFSFPVRKPMSFKVKKIYFVFLFHIINILLLTSSTKYNYLNQSEPINWNRKEIVSSLSTFIAFK